MKKILVLIIFVLLMATGCNKQLVDFEYTYNKAICDVGGEVKEIEIKKWNDYDGEQIQIIGKDENTYLVSTNICMLIKEK